MGIVETGLCLTGIAAGLAQIAFKGSGNHVEVQLHAQPVADPYQYRPAHSHQHRQQTEQTDGHQGRSSTLMMALNTASL